jgi:hypothetical protein
VGKEGISFAEGKRKQSDRSALYFRKCCSGLGLRETYRGEAGIITVSSEQGLPWLVVVGRHGEPDL